MSNRENIIEVENLSKQYRLGEISTGSLGRDLTRWWARVRGREDPTLSVTRANVRDQKTEKLKREKNTKPGSFQPFNLSAFQRFSPSAFSSDYVWALQDINFEVKRGEVLGIIGCNGAGKSTLLKILSRVTAPTTGEIRVDGRIASLLEVGTGFHPDLTGRENIFLNGAILGMTKAEIQSKLDEIVEFSGCARYVDTPVKRYSSGMVVRLGFAVAAHLEPDILIVDEVLAVGDFEFQKKCIGKMQDVAAHGRTVLFVSHNMNAVERLCKSALILEEGRIRMSGTSDEVVKSYLRGFSEEGSRKQSRVQHGILYAAPDDMEKDVYIKSIILKDDKGELVSRVKTWSDLSLEVVVYSKEDLTNTAFELHFLSPSEELLANISSDQDLARPLALHAGGNRFTIRIYTLPLSAGACFLRAGVALRHTDWLDVQRVGLEIAGSDVYKSGSVPVMSKKTVALQFDWAGPVDVGEDQ